MIFNETMCGNIEIKQTKLVWINIKVTSGIDGPTFFFTINTPEFSV